jgi:hypothetical protein
MKIAGIITFSIIAASCAGHPVHRASYWRSIVPTTRWANVEKLLVADSSPRVPTGALPHHCFFQVAVTSELSRSFSRATSSISVPPSHIRPDVILLPFDG